MAGGDKLANPYLITTQPHASTPPNAEADLLGTHPLVIGALLQVTAIDYLPQLAQFLCITTQNFHLNLLLAFSFPRILRRLSESMSV